MMKFTLRDENDYDVGTGSAVWECDFFYARVRRESFELYMSSNQSVKYILPVATSHHVG